MKVLALLLSLTLLVITHELGHLGIAKLFHTRVRRFYVFFNWKFSIFKAKKFDGKWHFLFFNAETPESWNEENMKEEGIRIDLGEAEKIDEKSYTITPEAIEDGENKGKLKAITIKRDAGK